MPPRHLPPVCSGAFEPTPAAVRDFDDWLDPVDRPDSPTSQVSPNKIPVDCVPQHQQVDHET
jgi:hypothetical protein